MRKDKDSEVGNEKLEETQLLATEISVPPQDVEDTVRELKRRGLVAGEETFMTPTRAKFGWAVAAALIFFVFGFGTASQLSGGELPQQEQAAPSEVDERSVFILMVRESKGMLQTDLPEKELIREYSAWAGELASTGVLVDGEKLNDGRRLLTQGNSELLVDAVPAVDSGEYVSGFFMIRARDYDEAVEIASTCPHIRYGGIIEVREIYRG